MRYKNIDVQPEVDQSLGDGYKWEVNYGPIYPDMKAAQEKIDNNQSNNKFKKDYFVYQEDVSVEEHEAVMICKGNSSGKFGRFGCVTLTVSEDEIILTGRTHPHLFFKEMCKNKESFSVTLTRFTIPDKMCVDEKEMLFSRARRLFKNFSCSLVIVKSAAFNKSSKKYVAVLRMKEELICLNT